MAHQGGPSARRARSPMRRQESGEAAATPLPVSRAARWPNRDAYAAIDLGTNNCRLLIAKPSADGFIVVDAFSRIVRLGGGLASTGRVSDAPLDRGGAAPALFPH